MSSTFRDVATVVFARGFVRAAQFLSFLILARFLTVEEFGWFGLVTSAIALAVTLGSLGLRQSVAYQQGSGEVSQGQSLATSLVLFPVLAAASSAGVLLLYGDALPTGTPLLLKASIVLATSGSLLVTILQGIPLAKGDIRSFSLSETSPRVILAVACVFFAAAGFMTLPIAMSAYALGFVVTAPLLLFSVSRGVSGISIPPAKKIFRMIGFGGVFAINLFLILGMSRLSMFLLEHYHGANLTGLFFAALRANELLLEVAAAVGIVAFSSSVREVSTDKKTFADQTSKLSRLVFWAFTIAGFAVAPFSERVVTILAGSSYRGAGPAMLVLSLSLGIASANKVIYPAVAGRGRPLFGTPAIVIGLAVTLLASILLIPKFDLVGAATSIAAGQATIFALYVFSFGRAYGSTFGDFLFPKSSDIKETYLRIKNRIAKSK